MLDEISEENESNKKKIFVIILGIFMIFLLISYFIVYSGTNIHIIAGFIGSSNIKENIIELNELTIIINPDVQEELISHYIQNEGHEMKLCLLGDKNKDTIHITSIHYPNIISQSFQHVQSEPCPIETFISIHSHPNRQCIPSHQDLITHKSIQKRNPDILSAIMCDTNRLHFYG